MASAKFKPTDRCWYYNLTEKDGVEFRRCPEHKVRPSLSKLEQQVSKPTEPFTTQPLVSDSKPHHPYKEHEQDQDPMSVQGHPTEPESQYGPGTELPLSSPPSLTEGSTAESSIRRTFLDAIVHLVLNEKRLEPLFKDFAASGTISHRNSWKAFGSYSFALLRSYKEKRATQFKKMFQPEYENKLRRLREK